MTIEIEAGASQSQFSMKPLVVHAFFDRPGGLSTIDADLSRQGPLEKDPVRFPESQRDRERQRDTIPKPSPEEFQEKIKSRDHFLTAVKGGQSDLDEIIGQ
jgi:hypothetical protein